MSQVVVDFSKRMRTEHIHYVALGRVTSIDGLVFIRFLPEDIQVSNEVKSEMARMRQNRSLNTVIQDCVVWSNVV